MKRASQVLIATVALTASSVLLASSGGGFNTGSFSSQRIDQQYELGKSYYKSAQADGTRLEYCIQGSNGLKKLSRKSVRQFKNGPVSNFVGSLYNCANPQVKIADAVPQDQGDAILYYLNKRFKLRLKAG